MQLIDQVDRNDKVVGQTTKLEAHRLGLPHRIATVYVFNKKNEILIQHRAKDGLWGESVSGHVHKGESYERAAYREMAEELGITKQKITWVAKCLEEVSKEIEAARLAWIKKNFPELNFSEPVNIKHFHGVFELIYEGEFQIKPDEVAKVGFHPLAEIIESTRNEYEKFTPGFIASMNAYLKAKKLKFEPIPYR